MEPRILLNA
ncbi:LEPR-XLL domain-containing protein [Aeromonas sp. ARM81]|nr:LEPR-XLL domain-containing protein [Aeromonas sp. ARM81]